MLAEFRVGYSPSAWDRMLLGARQSGFTEEELMAAGLAQRGKSGGLYDRFRGRIMFPLADARGKVLGFGARQMGEGRGPKYLNTSENDLYHKGRQLFGIDVARKEAMKTGRFVVVEGYTDVLALHQAGIREAVAIMGTAMTQEQLAELAKVGDSSRRGAVYPRARRRPGGPRRDAARGAAGGGPGVDLRVVDMPEGTDPADLVSRGRGRTRFMERMDRAAPMIEFQVRRVLADADLDTPAGRDRALEEARKLISAVPERTATRDALVREAADRLDVPVDYVLRRCRRARSAVSVRRARPGVPRRARFRAEREFLTRCLSSGTSDATTLRGLPTTSSPPTFSGGRATTWSSTSTTRSRPCPRTTPRSARSSPTWRSPRRSGRPREEPVLRMSILQLEQRRIEREIRRASQEGDHARKGELAAAEQKVRDEHGHRDGADGMSEREELEPHARRARTGTSTRRRRRSRPPPTCTTRAVSSRPGSWCRLRSRARRTRSGSTCARSAACRF